MRINDWSSDVCSSDLPTATYANSQAAFSKFLANNGCTETDVNHVSLPVPKGELITGIDVAYTSACSRGKDNAFVAIDGGGHSWPGLNRNFDILPIDQIGRASCRERGCQYV